MGQNALQNKELRVNLASRRPNCIVIGADRQFSVIFQLSAMEWPFVSAATSENVHTNFYFGRFGFPVALRDRRIPSGSRGDTSWRST
jgi:hypothetical protein